MENNNNKKWKVAIFVALILGGISFAMVAYAAVSQTLNITGSAKVSGPDWNILFQNLGTAVETGEATEDTTPSLTDTAISNIKAVFEGSGSLSYEFDVVNRGSINARIGTLTKLTNPICTGVGTNKENDETLVCSQISTELTYSSDGATVQQGDILDAGETKRMKFTITYTASSTLNHDEVNVSGLGATIIYIEN